MRLILNPTIRLAVDFIDRNLQSPPSALDVAGRLHFNASYFSVLFKQEAGMTFSAYLSWRRLERAKEMLLQTELRVYEIAERTGYQSASYFVKVFRKSEGMTPKQYRDKHRVSYRG